MKSLAQIIDIITDTIENDEYRMRVYPDGLVSVHIQDYNDTVGPSDKIPEVTDIVLSVATAYKFGITAYNALQTFSETERGGVNPARPKSISEYQLIFNRDLPTPLDTSFALSCLNLEFIKNTSGGGGGGSADPDFFYSGVGISYIGNATQTPTLSAPYRQRNVSGVALTGTDTITVTFAQPLSEIWGLNITFGKFIQINNEVFTPSGMGYLVFPIFTGPNITGLQITLNKSILPSVGVELVVLDAAADAPMETVIDISPPSRYTDAITSRITASLIKGFSRSPAPAGQNILSGSLFRIEHPPGKFTAAGFRTATGYGSGLDFIDINNTNYYPLPFIGNTETSYYLAGLGPTNGSTISGIFQPYDTIQVNLIGNEFVSVDVSAFGKLA